MILPYQSFFIIVQIVYWRNANVDKLTLGKKRPPDFLIPYWYSVETGSEAISKSGSDVTDH